MKGKNNSNQEVDVQVISVDCGRSNTKGYSEYDGDVRKTIFNSCMSRGRMLPFEEYTSPVAVEIDGEKLFFGNLALSEGETIVPNQTDEKTTNVVEKLIGAVISKLSVADNIALMITVPHSEFNKKVMAEIESRYLNKVYRVKDMAVPESEVKEVTIISVKIAREAQSALIGELADNPELTEGNLAFLTSGYMSIEGCYYSNGKYNDKRSFTIPGGMSEALNSAVDYLQREQGETIHHRIVDTEERYKDIKNEYLPFMHEQIYEEINYRWRPLSTTIVKVGGGTMLALAEKLGEKFKFELCHDPIYCVARGGFLIMQDSIG